MSRFTPHILAAPILAIPILATLALAWLALGASTAVQAASDEEINALSDQAIERLYTESSAAKQLGAKAAGMLIFPDITKGGFIVGGEYGEGVLRIDNRTVGYYQSASGSIGLQIGVSSRSLVIMFLAEEALEKFKNSSGWEAGVDADVTAIDIGATGAIDSTTLKKPVVAFNFGESGLMAGISVEGTKVTKLER